MIRLLEILSVGSHDHSCQLINSYWTEGRQLCKGNYYDFVIFATLFEQLAIDVGGKFTATCHGIATIVEEQATTPFLAYVSFTWF